MIITECNGKISLVLWADHMEMTENFLEKYFWMHNQLDGILNYFILYIHVRVQRLQTETPQAACGAFTCVPLLLFIHSIHEINNNIFWRKYLVIFTVKSSYITHPQLQVHFTLPYVS